MSRLSPPLQRYALIAIAALFTACIALDAAAAAEDGKDTRIGERPNSGGPADEISISLGLLDIDGVDDKEQRFSVDVYFEIRWRDHRLAVSSDAGQKRKWRTFPAGDIWTPGLTIVNNRGLSLMLPEVADADYDGNVVMRQRLSGRLAVDLDLQHFPFDTQRLAIDIVSYRHSASELVFATDTRFVANPSTFSAAGWQFEVLQPEYSVFRLDKDGAGTSQLTLAVQAKRNSDFFVLTLALPMTLILFMAWTVHWLQPTVVPARMGMSTATVFSLIALGVSFRLSLPQIDYLTQADRFVIYSTLLVLISLGITVITTRWVNADREASAVRLTFYTRWAFPLIFAAIVALTLRQ